MSINIEHFTSSNLFEHYDFSIINQNNNNNNSLINKEVIQIEDLIVFIALESLGTLAITLNICLCVVLFRHKYLNRPSFILMLSLALADVLHGFVTTCFFYPPILLKKSFVPSIGIKLFNILDWTAWSITLTHMSAICLDRLLAIIMYNRYNLFITVNRAKKFTIICWIAFFVLNIAYIIAKFCCLITPLREIHFYTFGYGEFESEEQLRESPFKGVNLFKLTYTPLELCTLAILSISNPITLIQLYRRHKRKMALRIQRTPPIGVGDAILRRASTMLLEVSMRMGSKHINNNELRTIASRRANRQQQRILLQISVVAIIFYLYMFAYYLLYHVFNVSNKWVVLFNSFFYSTTHMINPVIYFSLNKDMRAQLIRAISDFLHWLCCVAGDARLHAAGTSSIYGRVKRGIGGGGGGDSSSTGGSPLRKSSPIDSSVQPGGSDTPVIYRVRSTSFVHRDCWNCFI
ncbi:G_PROTEIN_RECEP_F1_2 domain-containing protein [Meloidogyne graminicola]|uniref:G_PROTEIN_RECEP_F1_2 domain-containing protein n=1 Tax=Meloidogyne graminicola TaxID=189291 RepID=A0A8S9ZFX5_9BILA|nr:G_PROTEIN_RECEP_F1_2 domain-containing protein [Meloidogyne graminicola]